LGTSTLITRITSDVNQVQTGVNITLRLLLRSPFIVFGAMIMAFTIDVKSALIFVAVIVALLIVVFGIMLISIPLYRHVQSKLDDVTLTTRENLTGIRVLRAFCMEQSETEKFNHQNEMLSKMQKHVGIFSALMNPVTYVILNSAILWLIWTGAIQVSTGILTQGAVVALYNYMSQILIELIKLANLIITMTKSVACGKRVQSVLEYGAKDFDHDNNKKIIETLKKGTITFENVTFSYNNSSEPSLHDISFSAKSGETVGIIGGTGSGKTTLVNLISRLYPATSGTIKIDDFDIDEFSQKDLRKRFGIVPQKAVLFKGSIKQNLLWGKEDATEEEMYKALEVAQAKEIVENKENGLDSVISEGGQNLSGGQRQRLTIARAIVRNPEFLILDDSASALDYATDAALRHSLQQLTPKPTVFIVSQRASSVRYADKIIVLDDGYIVGSGTHEQLLKNCTVYQEIYYSQFPKEVASNGK
ncbi:MAG: ABC transporter ATP-binding protein, partial [Ruminococcus sp.]|nr:ABC transporter ATP-binding protein [Ruminococcus sp.]